MGSRPACGQRSRTTSIQRPRRRTSRPRRPISFTPASSATGESGPRPPPEPAPRGYAGPMSQTVELPRVGGPGSGLGELWRVVVLNDEHNTFDHVAETLSRVIPGVSLAQGYRLADQIHKTGLAIVWSGPRDEAQQYWEQLDSAGLTMAPLEAG